MHNDNKIFSKRWDLSEAMRPGGHCPRPWINAVTTEWLLGKEQVCPPLLFALLPWAMQQRALARRGPLVLPEPWATFLFAVIITVGFCYGRMAWTEAELSWGTCTPTAALVLDVGDAKLLSWLFPSCNTSLCSAATVLPNSSALTSLSGLPLCGGA